MPRSLILAIAILFFTTSLFADDQRLWQEYGLQHIETSKHGKLTITAYAMKDLTGALAAWEWLRSPDGRACNLAPFCTEESQRLVISDFNYVLVFTGAKPSTAEVESVRKVLPSKHETSLPAILSFLPRQGLVSNSARYVLGPVSLQAFAPELASIKAGFNEEAEAPSCRIQN